MNTKSTKFSKISNYFFIFSIVFVLCFVWINYYIHKPTYALCISIIITTTFGIILIPIRYKIIQKQQNINNEKNNFESIKNQLIYGNLQYNVSYLLALFNINIKQKVNPKHYIDNNDNDILFILESNDILDNHIKYCNSHNITIFTIEKNIVFTYLDKNLNIVTYMDIYNKISEYNLPPCIYISNKKPHKYSLKDIISIIFNRARARQYLQMGLLTLLLSLFTFYPIYYILTGTILTIMSVIARFNSLFNHE